VNRTDSNVYNDFEVIKAYVDSTKSFVQLSSAGLALPLALRSAWPAIAASSGAFHSYALVSIVFSWICFLTAIATGTFYQYLGIKYIEVELSKDQAVVSSLVRRFVANPGNFYGAMLIAFFLGAFSIFVYSAGVIIGT